MDDLTYALRKLCRRNRDGSHATQGDRLRSLTLIARELREEGFRNMQLTSLKRKHVDALVRRWQAKGLSAGTQKNRLAHLRWWAEKIGRSSVIPASSAELGIPERRFVTNESKARELSAGSLEKVRDPHVLMSLVLQQMFGLRREEAIKFQPRYADRGDHILLKHSWTKGGRERVVPILNAEQRAALDQAHKLAGAGSLIPPHRSYIEQRDLYDGKCNDRGVPSPGSTWRRKVRRCAGWMGSAVRVILKNPLYTGMVRWNVSQFVRDPDSEKYKRRKRPKAEWHSYQDESLRIISDELFAKVERRTRVCANGDQRLESGGRPKYLLSGLLHCRVCGAHYVIADARSYACSGHWNGGACSNSIRVRRDAIERVLLGPIRSELQSPERRARVAKEMQAAYVERIKAIKQRAASVPQEAAQLDARIDRLRERLKNGDPDLTSDELQMAIERAEAKRRELEHARSPVGSSAQILSILPKAAEYYGQQISLGLDGDPAAAAKARPIVRELLGGKVDLVPGEDGSLWAEYGLHMAALLQGAGTCGRGERI